jgi:hypothetical protein
VTLSEPGADRTKSSSGIALVGLTNVFRVVFANRSEIVEYEPPTPLNRH